MNYSCESNDKLPSCKNEQEVIFRVSDFLITKELKDLIQQKPSSVKGTDTTFILAKNSEFLLLFDYNEIHSTAIILKNNKVFIKIKKANLNWFFYDESNFNSGNWLLAPNTKSIYIADYNADQNKDLIVTDRVHNGTLNSLMERVFEFDNKGKLAKYAFSVSSMINRMDDCVLFKLHCGSHYVFSRPKSKNAKWKFHGKLSYEMRRGKLQIFEKMDSLLLLYPPIIED